MVALLHELFPWALAFFAANAITFASGRLRLLVSWRGEPYGLRRRGLLAPGLLPWAEVLAVLEPRLWPTGEALWLPASRGDDDVPFPQAGDTVAVPWLDLVQVQAQGRNVHAGGRRLLEARTPEAAAALSSLIGEWARCGDERQRRAAIAAWLAQRRSLSRLRPRRQAQVPLLRRLQGASTACFALGFVALPISLYAPEQPSQLALLVFAGATLAAALVVWTAFTMLGAAGVDGAARRRALEPMLFYPPLAAHAPSFVARELYADFAPCAVAAALGSREAARALAAEELLEIEVGRARTDPALFAAYWDARAAALSALALEAGLGPPERLLDRSRQDPQAVAYCPACDTEYRAPVPACAECGIGLRSWPDE